MRKPMSLLQITLVVGILLPLPVFAQRTVQPGALEAGLYSGGTFDLPGAAGYVGICQVRFPDDCAKKFQVGRKSQPFLGANVAVALHKILWLYGDYSYMFSDRSTAAVDFLGSTGVTTTSRHYWLAGGGVQLTFPTVQRVVPYVEVGADFLHQSYSTATSYTNVLVSGGVAGNIFRSRSSPRDLPGSFAAPHVGGGVRVFVGERHGLRFSVDGFYVSNGIEQQVPGANPGVFPVITKRGFGRITAGYFMRFGRR